MKIITRAVMDMETLQWIPELEESYIYEGPVALCIRSAANAAQKAATTASDTGATLGSESQAQQAQLNPFYTQEMHAEHGIDPTQTNELLTNALAGSGGSAGALTGQAELQAARTRNPSGFTKALDEASRNQDKAAAGASEGIAAQDVLGAKQLNQEGAAGEAGLYGENLKGQLAAMGQEAPDINAQTQANTQGWVQNMDNIIKTLKA